MRSRYAALLSLALAVIFAWALLQAREWPFQARYFPWTIGLVALALTLVQLARDLGGRAAKGAAPQVDFAFSEGLPPAVVRWRTLNIFAWSWAFFLAVWLLGFAIAIVAIFFLYLKVQSRERWPLSLALTAGAWAFLWGVFERFLHLPLPEGQLFRWFLG